MGITRIKRMLDGTKELYREYFLIGGHDLIVPRRRYYPSADCRYSGPASVHPAVVSRAEVADTLKSIRRTVLYGINAWETPWR